MRPAYFFRSLTFVVSLVFVHACGSQAPEPEAASPLSLTGFPAGTKWPCQDFSHSFGANQHTCLNLPAGNSSSSPAIDVLIELRGFDSAQADKVKSAVREFARHWHAMRADARSPNDSGFGKCLDAQVSNRMWAESSIFPEAHRNKAAAISWAVQNIQYMFEFHAKNKIPLVIAATSREGIMGQAYLGTDGSNSVNGDIELGIPSLNDSQYDGLIFAGTLMHEWFHRKGYNHPESSYGDSEYEASLVVASGICVRSGNVSGLSLFGPAILRE